MANTFQADYIGERKHCVRYATARQTEPNWSFLSTGKRGTYRHSIEISERDTKQSPKTQIETEITFVPENRGRFVTRKEYLCYQ